MGHIKNNLDKLKEVDVYSLLLFCLYRLTTNKENPHYSALSELVYVLDKKNFMRFIEYFGGSTIQVPTVFELKQLTYALLLYQYVDIEHMDYTDAVKIIGHEAENVDAVKQTYKRISEILSQYSFNPRG